MTIPDTKEIVGDGNLAFARADSDSIVAFIGPASGGTVGTVYSFSDPASIVSSIGVGPAVEAMATILEAAGGTVLWTKPATSADSAPTVAQPSGTPPAVGAAGSVPLDVFDGIVKIIVGGIRATATFKVSLDGGDTWTPEIVTAATYTGLMATYGITITFASGTYVVNDQYTFSTVGPQMSISQFNTAFDTLKVSPLDWSLLHVVGIPAGADDDAKVAAAAALAAAVQSKLDSAFTSNHVFARAVIEGPDIANDSTGDGKLITAIASTVAPRVMLVGDFGEIRSPISSKVFKRPAAWPVTARLKAGSISEDAGYVQGEQAPGRLMSSLISIRRDEAQRSALNDQRVTTLRTFKRRAGFYVTKPKTLADVGSDYELLQHGRIVDKMCATTRDFMLPKLNGKLRTNSDGTILETVALKLETDLKAALGRDLVTPNHLQSVNAKINRTDNLISTKKIRVKVSGLPFAYPEQIEETLGFAVLTAQAA